LKEDKEIKSEILLELASYAFLRLDGAWCMATAERFGVEAATELDIKAWEMFSERLGRRIVSVANLQGEFSQVVPKLMKFQNKLMNMTTEIKVCSETKVIHTVIDCEVWKMVSKVWTRESAPCYNVTQAIIRGILKGAFPGKEFIINHKQKIPLGDPCCEVEITLKNPA